MRQNSCPTPEEILRRRIAIHRQRGEHNAAEQLAERLEDGDQNPYSVDVSELPPKMRPLSSLGLRQGLVGVLESYKVVVAGDLCDWSAERLRLIGCIGEPSLAEIRRALGSVGLYLRRPMRGETPEPLPPPIRYWRPDGRTTALPASTVRAIIRRIAAGNSQRRIAAELGVSRWSVWDQLRQHKEIIRCMLADGMSESDIRRKIGETQWRAWETAKRWERRGRQFRAKPAAA